MKALAIEIGGTKLQLALGDPATGKLTDKYRYQVDPAKGAAGILEQIRACVVNLPEPPELIAVGFGGPVISQAGIIANSHQIGGWAGFDLKRWFHEQFGILAHIENDANTAAMGEATFGVGKDFKSLFYITLGSGVGGGMVSHGRLYRGRDSGEAEIGHLRLDRAGNTLESLCSGWALDQAIRTRLTQNDDPSILRTLILTKQGEAQYLKTALEQNDGIAWEIFKNYCEWLALGISHAVHLFNPELIVLGGGVSLIGEVLIDQVKRLLPNYLMESFRPGPAICAASLGEEVVLVGALSLLSKLQNND